jgi:hypothetical protein
MQVDVALRKFQTYFRWGRTGNLHLRRIDVLNSEELLLAKQKLYKMKNYEYSTEPIVRDNIQHLFSGGGGEFSRQKIGLWDLEKGFGTKFSVSNWNFGCFSFPFLWQVIFHLWCKLPILIYYLMSIYCFIIKFFCSDWTNVSIIVPSEKKKLTDCWFFCAAECLARRRR